MKTSLWKTAPDPASQHDMCHERTDEMEKSKIVIASSGRTLTLAEVLRAELQTEFCEARLWSEERNNQLLPANGEMLERTTQQYDFAVVILAKEDLIVREAGDASKRKARDNCLIEAGLFMASIGKSRCYLVNSVMPEDLPSDFSGINSIHFDEPSDLADLNACTRAITSVAAILKDCVQRTGVLGVHEQVPLLSVDDVFERERPKEDGGDLLEGQVVVCDWQPQARPELVGLVSHNLARGIRYMYFLHFTEDTIEKTCRALQVILIGGRAGKGITANLSTRLDIIREQKERILDDLRRLCRTRSLIVSLIPDEPPFCFRLHNASDAEAARLYMRYASRGYVLWSERKDAVSVLRTVGRYVSEDTEPRIFVPMHNYNPAIEAKQNFYNWFEQGLKKYFPGLESEVRQLCLGREWSQDRH
jgi:predicted nucleotide-binding protein